ncbi:uncharacterized protein BJX67DRAFT_362713 [Aspergillus lucknowensis]|uniref:RNA recognition motif-containing protein n=1 Tax=Aspergillus lucknowensis TaxID=176173 RepID=A0ABR4LGZ1_9EURO
MPPLPGEERVLTLFADIHYYFTAPTPKPLVHRFDKSSYLYLYHNAAQQKTRIEVANHPGTPDQDAFNGALDNVHLRHSTRFPTLCTMTVDGLTQAQGGLAFPPPPGNANSYEWQLPTNDPRGENTYQRLHTLDIYFWTQGDADQFLDLVERHISRAQIETDRHPFPPPPEASATSTVVQQLESVAITDPAYQNGQTRNSQAESVVSPTPIPLPPPPPGGGPAQPIQPTSSASPLSDEQKRDSSQFTPLPYNPAAPAAPEPIKHREKTPPPPDAADGTGLAAAIAADQGLPYQPPSQTPGYGPPPQQSQATSYALPGAYASPPPSAGISRTGSFPPQAPLQGPPTVPSYPPQTSIQSSPVPTYPPTYPAGAGQHQQSQIQPHQQFPPNAANPTAHLYGPQQHQQHQQQAQQPPSFYGTQVPAIGGYSNYSYDKSSHPQPQHQSSNSLSPPGPVTGSEYDVHNQMYRPTEAEANSHLQAHAKLAVQNPGQRPRKLEDSAARVESSVNRFLKKLEKKL